ncbi:uncharacterized protein LOC111028550 [Myzus persicae]|uniref:uncharacterized protein LOC111028550 n=1 Tax=Myzus persicae TaxID=13164 RepID=UPI000B936336|nr:uncharacterized protein LOC111028550 [Myzus persicae]XP_022162933.1 uncharacterized protein LOC111028550 [Myzus persicae]
MKFNLILLVLCMAFIVESLGDEHPYWDKKVRFCGSILGDELSIICKGVYNEHQSYSSKPKRNVADECCKTACTRRYLKVNYCGPDPETTTIMTADTTPQPELYQ